MSARVGIPQRKHTAQPGEADLYWRDRASCHGYTAEIFFPNKGDAGSARHAKLICRECPVKKPCLLYALTHNEIHGVWGGTSANERRELARRKKHDQH